ncbi:MAG: ABC transporter substrate-binding protein [Pseudomonadota bacterium]
MNFAKFRAFIAPWGYCAGLLALLWVLPVGAADELRPPQKVIQEASDKLQERLQDKSFISDFARVNRYVAEVIDPHVHFNRMSLYVLGKHWRNADPDQRARFKKEFRAMLIRTYSRAFTEFKEWNIRYLPLRMNSQDKKVVVKTEILQPGIRPVAVNYRMVNDRGTWKVYDITIEGVSLVTNYRSDFSRDVERTGSLESVIARLASRNSKAFHTGNHGSAGKSDS